MEIKKKTKRIWALILAWTLLFSVVPEGTMITFASDNLPVSDEIQAPVSDVENGVYSENVLAFLTSETDGVEIYYTTDGTEPTLNSIKYSRIMSLNGSAGKSVTYDVKAIAVKEIEGKKYRSDVSEFTYTVQLPSEVKLIWPNTLIPEDITGEVVNDKYQKVWKIGYSESFPEIIFTAAEGYFFPDGYGSTASNGVEVERIDANSIRVSGVPIADVEIEMIAPSLIVEQASTLYFGTYSQIMHYGDSPYTLVVAGGEGTGAITYESSNPAVASVNANTGEITIHDIGDFYITATKAASDGYTAASKRSEIITVAPKKITVEGIKVTDREYDGTDKVIVSGGTLSGVLESDLSDVTLVAEDNIAGMKDMNAGQDKILAYLPDYRIEGAKADKYQLEDPVAKDYTVNISKKIVDITGVKIADKIYDKTNSATVIYKGDLNKDDILSSDIQNLQIADVTNAVKFDDVNVNIVNGEIFEITATADPKGFVLAGSAAGNYEIGNVTVESAKITPKDVEVSVSPVEKGNGYIVTTEEALTVTLEGVMPGDELELPKAYITENTVADADEEKDIQIRYVGGNPGKNYNYTYNTESKLTGYSVPIIPEEDIEMPVNIADWVNEDIVLTPINGYKFISTDCLVWKENITISTEGVGEISVYLKKEDGTTTEVEVIPYKLDKTAPEGVITFNEVQPLVRATYRLFFKNNVDVKITANDQDTLSGIDSIYYQIVDIENGDETYVDSEESWIEYEDLVRVNSQREIKVFAKLVDVAGNYKIIDSEGAVIYHGVIIPEQTEDVIPDYRTGTEKEEYKDTEIVLDKKDNTIKEVVIKKGDTEYKIDYELSEDGIVLSSGALDVLTKEIGAAGEVYTGIVYYYPWKDDMLTDDNVDSEEFKIKLTYLKEITTSDYSIETELLNQLQEGRKEYDSEPLLLSPVSTSIVTKDPETGESVKLKFTWKVNRKLIGNAGEWKEVNPSVVPVRDATEYQISLYAEESEYYRAYTSETYNYTIDKRNILFKWVDSYDREYDCKAEWEIKELSGVNYEFVYCKEDGNGAWVQADGTAVFENNSTTDAVSLVGLSLEYPSANAGEYTGVKLNVDIEGEANDYEDGKVTDNYNLICNDISGEITPITIDWIVPDVELYVGQTFPEPSIIEISGWKDEESFDEDAYPTVLYTEPNTGEAVSEQALTITFKYSQEKNYSSNYVWPNSKTIKYTIIQPEYELYTDSDSGAWYDLYNKEYYVIHANGRDVSIDEGQSYYKYIVYTTLEMNDENRKKICDFYMLDYETNIKIIWGVGNSNEDYPLGIDKVLNVWIKENADNIQKDAVCKKDHWLKLDGTEIQIKNEVVANVNGAEIFISVDDEQNIYSYCSNTEAYVEYTITCGISGLKSVSYGEYTSSVAQDGTISNSDDEVLQMLDSGAGDGIAVIRVYVKPGSSLKDVTFAMSNVAGQEADCTTEKKVLVSNDTTLSGDGTYGEESYVEDELYDKPEIFKVILETGHELNGFKNISYSVNSENEICLLSDNNEALSADKYVVSIPADTFKDGGDFSVVIKAVDFCGNTRTISYNFKVKLKQPELKFENISNITYGDKISVVYDQDDSQNTDGLTLVGGAGNGEIKYTSSDNSVAVVDENGDIVIVGMGKFKLTAIKEADGAYQSATATSEEITVQKRKLSITGLVAKDKDYDGTDKVTITGGTLVNVANGDIVTVTMPTEGTAASKNVARGENNEVVAMAVTVEDIVLDNAYVDRYELEQPTGLVVKISPKELVLKVQPDVLEISRGMILSVGEFSISAEGFVQGENATSLEAYGFEWPTLDISSIERLMDVSVKAVNYKLPLATEGNATNNYKFNADSLNVDITVNSKLVNATGDYLVEGTHGNEGWYKSEVIIKPDGEYDYISNGIPEEYNYGEQTSINKTEDGSHTINISLYDKETGIITEPYPVNFKIDKTAPVFGTITYENGYKYSDVVNNNSLIMLNNRNLLLDYVLGNKAVIIKVAVSDGTSGVKEVKYTKISEGGNESGGVMLYKDGIAELTVEPDFKGTIKAVAYDVAGNYTSEVNLSVDGSGPGFVIENDKPSIKLTVNGTTDELDVSKYYELNEIESVWMTITEPAGIKSGLHSVAYKLGDDEIVYAEDVLGLESYQINLGSINQTTVIQVTVLDLAGNSNTVEYDVHVNANQEQLVISGYEQTQTYGDSFDLIVEGGSGDGALTYESSDSGVATVDENGHVTVVGIGEYMITVTKGASTGYYETSAVTEKITVNKKAVTVVGIEAEDRDYNGKNTVLIYGGSLEGVINDDDVTAVVPQVGIAANNGAVGQQQVTIADVTLSGIDSEKYVLLNPVQNDIKVNIGKVTLDISVEKVVINKGQKIPTLQVEVDGFLENDNASNIEGFELPTATVYGTIDTTDTTIKRFMVQYTGGNPGTNYQFTYNETAQIDILTVEPDVVITESGEWTGNDVIITPGEDFVSISKDGQNWSESLVYSETGEYDITVYVKKEDLSISEGKELSFKIDKEKPIIDSIEAMQDIKIVGGYVVGDEEIVIQFEVSDEHSGLESVVCTMGTQKEDINVSEDGSAKVTIPLGFSGKVVLTATDKVGKTTVVDLGSYLGAENGFVIEKSAPSIETLVNGEEIKSTYHCEEISKINVTVTDSGSITSGLESVSYTLNGKEVSVFAVADEIVSMQTFEIPVSLGVSEILIKVVDNVGNEVTKSLTVSVDHVWDVENVEYNWDDEHNVIATFSCLHNEEHVITKTCEVTSVTTPATCTEKGKTVYTAKVTFEGTEYTDVKEEKIEELGHVYGDAKFTWSEDYSSATVSFTCERNAEHVVTEICKITSVTIPATCTETGKTVYTAKVTFEGIEYTDVKEEKIAELGHVYGDAKFTWSEDYSSATASFTCERDAEHVVTKTCEVTSVTTPATCTETGKTVYTAKVTFEGTEYTDVKEEGIAELGHAYEDVKFAWTEDYSSATVSFTCEHDAEHVVTETCEVTSVTIPATCTETGKTVYTAKVTFEGTEYTDVKEEKIAELGHVYGDAKFTWSEDYSSATASFTCERDAEHVVTETCEVTSVTTPATCTETGKTVYTAKVTFEGTEYTDVKEEEIAELGHAYEDVKFTWTEDYSSAIARFTCKHDITHVEDVEATVVKEIVKKATGTGKGEIRYTATAVFEGTTYTDEKTIITTIVESESIGDGSITTEIEVGKGVPKTVIENLTITVAKDLLTQEEFELVKNGEDVTVYLQVTDVNDIVSEEEKDSVEVTVDSMIDDLINENNYASSTGILSKIQYVDLSLFMRIGDDLAKKLDSTNDNQLLVTMEIPEEMKSENGQRIYYMLRIQDGSQPELVEISYNAENEVISFETDKSSTYALVYIDTTNAEEKETTTEPGDSEESTESEQTTEKTEEEENTPTGDTVDVKRWMLLMLAALGLVAVSRKKEAK